MTFAMPNVRNAFVEFASGAQRLFDQILAKPWISYVLVGALQTKILWGIWRYRDLTTGDTSSYFNWAYQWYERLAVNIVWSPLYTSFYGTILAAAADVYAATILHRAIIVMAATLGVLALMRQLLPPALALLVAVWWAVLPINFETLYEVHLFALLPILAAWLVVSRNDTPWTRGAAAAILLGTIVLARNEIVVAFGLFAVICLVREIGESRQPPAGAGSFWGERIAAYGIPITVAIGVCAVFYWRSAIKFPEIEAALHAKHALNMCQVFAFGYAQRHPEWTLSPWLECGGLTKSIFGHEWPTLLQMLTNNPAAAFEHILWNLSLTLNGFQVNLFNSMSGTVNPDYAPVRRHMAALPLTLCALAIVVTAAVKVWRNWDFWWRTWFRERRGVWLLMIAVLFVAIPIIVTQRPRPSYLFASTVVLMAVIGSAVHVLLTPRWRAVPAFLAMIGIPILIAVVPSYYAKHRSDRPLYINYERLRPFQALFDNRDNRILFGDYNGEFRGYLRITKFTTFDYGLLQSWKSPQPLDEFLDAQRINIVFIQPRVMPELRARPEARQFLEQPESLGWRRLAPADDSEDTWLLLYRAPRAPASG
jgi:hypothetical protein